MKKPAEYYALKGIISELPKVQQEQLENLHKAFMMIAKNDIVNSAIALGLIAIELDELLEGV